jgi:hypothetical protein
MAMTRRWIGGVLLAGAAAWWAGAGTGAADDGPRWINDYAEARAAARASGKPIFLVFRCER